MAELAGDAFLARRQPPLAADEQERDELRAEHDALHADGFAVDGLDELPERLAGSYHAAIVNRTTGRSFPGDGAASGVRAVEAERMSVRGPGHVTRRPRCGARRDRLGRLQSGLVAELDDIVRPTRVRSSPPSRCPSSCTAGRTCAPGSTTGSSFPTAGVVAVGGATSRWSSSSRRRSRPQHPFRLRSRRWFM